jgi:7-cyano-7-deazaguanine synthase
MQKSVVLLSGGLDSAVAFKKALDEYGVAMALTFDYGQRAAKREIAAAAAMALRFDVPHEVVNIPWLKKITKTALVDKGAPLPEPDIDALDDAEKSSSSAEKVWVPNRNGVFINIAAAYCESIDAGMLIAGFNAEEAVTFPDNSPAFISAANKALSYSTLSRVQVLSPTSELNKTEIVRLGMEIDAPLDLVWSCYEGGEVMCGVCESCMRLRRALVKAGSDLNCFLPEL